MMSLALLKSVPIWTGWNTQLTKDPLQWIGYMENMNLPPTRNDVVAKTMWVSQKVATECGEQYALVYYDLAIAEPALQIQAQDSPKYDNVFVCFGPFHIQMAFFTSLSYLITESGCPQILTDSEVLACGSINGFLSGKHFNRSKCLHPLPSTTLHFRSFLTQNDSLPDALLDELRHLNEERSPEVLKAFEKSTVFHEAMETYERYTAETRLGDHGSTAQFWITYIDLVELYLLFSRVCHTNDIDLFIYCLGKMCYLFFAASCHNYRNEWWDITLICWMLKQPILKSAECWKLVDCHTLPVRRSKRGFTRSPVDLVLEQTINADAGSRLTGIIAFTQSIIAQKWWMVTKAIWEVLSLDIDLLSQAGFGHQDFSVRRNQQRSYHLQGS